jgi:hypothetical protein
MSHRTDKYVLEILDRDQTLTSGERNVLSVTSLTVLSTKGYVYVEHRAGRASIVAFPIQGFVTGVEAPPGPGRYDESGQFHPSICGCLWCQEQTG